MLFVDNSRFNLTLLANVITVVTDKSILSFANSKSNTSMPTHCSCVAVFYHTVVLNTHSGVRPSVRNMLLSVGILYVTLKVKSVLCFDLLLNDPLESHHCR